MSRHIQQGLSLVELMIALAISSVVLAGMYRAFIQQQQLSTQQEQLTDVRQNARLSMDAMIEEIRDAGFDPGGLARAGIKEADATHIRFTRDLNCNGTLARSTAAKGVLDSGSEDIAYIFNADSQVLGRLTYIDDTPKGGTQPVASNILDLNLCYILANALSGPCTSDAADLIGNLTNIRAVQITLTARATASDPSYVDLDTNHASQYRHYRKATLTSLVRLRNLGVNRGQYPDGTSKVLDFNETCVLPRQ